VQNMHINSISKPALEQSTAVWGAHNIQRQRKQSSSNFQGRVAFLSVKNQYSPCSSSSHDSSALPRRPPTTGGYSRPSRSGAFSRFSLPANQRPIVLPVNDGNSKRVAEHHSAHHRWTMRSGTRSLAIGKREGQNKSIRDSESVRVAVLFQRPGTAVGA
jgi:hypothetical protein